MPVSSPPRHILFRIAWPIVLLAAWCIVIYVVSDRPNLSVSDDDLVDFIVRKAAHVGEYALLALLALRVTARLDDAPSRAHVRTRAYVCAWLFSVAYAISDEWHQTFVAGRVGHPRDVAIDTAGASVALFVAWRIAHRRRTRTSRAPDHD